MNRTCIIVDDEPLARNLLSEYVKKVPELDLLKAFGNPLEALNFLRENKVDILFLDIQMPDISGIDVARSFFEMGISSIFLTAYDNDGVEVASEEITLDSGVKRVGLVEQFFQEVDLRLRCQAIDLPEKVLR